MFRFLNSLGTSIDWALEFFELSDSKALLPEPLTGRFLMLKALGEPSRLGGKHAREEPHRLPVRDLLAGLRPAGAPPADEPSDVENDASGDDVGGGAAGDRPRVALRRRAIRAQALAWELEPDSDDGAPAPRSSRGTSRGRPSGCLPTTTASATAASR